MLFQYLKGAYRVSRVGLFSLVTGDRMRGNGLKLRQRWFRLDIRNNVFSKRVVLHCTAAQRLLGSLSLGVFQNCGDVALRDMVSGQGGVGLMAGPDAVSGLFQP